ncbi:hypothetical protein, partial [Streptomyces rhizosphaericus]|uniref:hypothetical protein n=1 Tax=Streptomyces rhizosphaericus TaxID=114699 RepID=UPI0031D680C1
AGLPVEPYQVMPALTDEEFAALKESLREHGCLVAVEYDEHGDVLDGHPCSRRLSFSAANSSSVSAGITWYGSTGSPAGSSVRVTG